MSSTKHCANKDLDAAIIFTPDQPNQDLSVEGNADSRLLFVVMRQRLAIRLLQLDLHVREHRHVILRYRTKVSQSWMYDSENKKMHLVLHAKLALALRSAPQLARVPEHIIQRHFRHGRKLVLADLAINNSPTARIQPADHRT